LCSQPVWFWIHLYYVFLVLWVYHFFTILLASMYCLLEGLGGVHWKIFNWTFFYKFLYPAIQDIFDNYYHRVPLSALKIVRLLDSSFCFKLVRLWHCTLCFWFNFGVFLIKFCMLFVVMNLMASHCLKSICWIAFSDSMIKVSRHHFVGCSRLYFIFTMCHALIYRTVFYRKVCSIWIVIKNNLELIFSL
jgi:hypothetical protein